MTKNRIVLTQLEIQVFCNMYYTGSEVGATITKDLGNGRYEVELDREISVKGNKYKNIMVNDRVKNMSQEELDFCFKMQKMFFDETYLN